MSPSALVEIDLTVFHPTPWLTLQNFQCVVLSVMNSRNALMFIATAPCPFSFIRSGE
jgi:hypothetical protein